MKKLGLLLGLLLVLIAVVGVALPGDPLPSGAAYALRTATQATFYSLDPYPTDVAPGDSTFHKFKILGQANLNQVQTTVATAAFLAAIPPPSTTTALYACFDPRHALRIVSDCHTYDFLLCYECRHLYVYRDDILLKDLSILGSPQVLDNLLASLHMPLYPTYPQKSPASASKT